MPDLIKPEHHAAITELTTHGQNAPARRRAKLLLLYDAGHSTAEVSQQVGLSVSSVLRWRRLYRQKSMGIFSNFEEQAAPASEPNQPDAAPASEPTQPAAAPVAKKEKPAKKKKTKLKTKKGKKKAGKTLKKKTGKGKKIRKALKKKTGKGKKAKSKK